MNVLTMIYVSHISHVPPCAPTVQTAVETSAQFQEMLKFTQKLQHENQQLRERLATPSSGPSSGPSSEAESGGRSGGSTDASVHCEPSRTSSSEMPSSASPLSSASSSTTAEPVSGTRERADAVVEAAVDSEADVASADSCTATVGEPARKRASSSDAAATAAELAGTCRCTHRYEHTAGCTTCSPYHSPRPLAHLASHTSNPCVNSYEAPVEDGVG
jgi:hypothetical protein